MKMTEKVIDHIKGTVYAWMPDTLKRRTSPENVADTLYTLGLMGWDVIPAPISRADVANVTGEDDALRAAALFLNYDHKRDSLRAMTVDGKPMTRADLAQRLLDIIEHARRDDANNVTLDRRDLFDFVRGAIKSAIDDGDGNDEMTPASYWQDATVRTERVFESLGIAALEREHLGDPDKRTGIYAEPRTAGEAVYRFGDDGVCRVKADPCPGCQPGGVCRTPTCGRLAAMNNVPAVGVASDGRKPYQATHGRYQPRTATHDDLDEWAGLPMALVMPDATECDTCEADGIYAEDGSGPFDCFKCGKKARAKPPVPRPQPLPTTRS